jgi:hypothetical protein
MGASEPPIRRGDYVWIDPPTLFGRRGGIVARVSEGPDGPICHVLVIYPMLTVGYPANRLRAFEPTFVDVTRPDEA